MPTTYYLVYVQTKQLGTSWIRIDLFQGLWSVTYGQYMIGKGITKVINSLVERSDRHFLLRER